MITFNDVKNRIEEVRRGYIVRAYNRWDVNFAKSYILHDLNQVPILTPDDQVTKEKMIKEIEKL